jgi:hypothetical protein
MRKLPLACFLVLLALAALVVWTRSGALPEHVASHFDAAGNPTSFLPREDFRRFLLIFTVGIPALVTFATAVLPRLVPRERINLPNKDYWLDPERADASVDFLTEQGLWFGCILVTFLTIFDGLVLRANAKLPVHLPGDEVVATMGIFFVILLFWIMRMIRRFRAPVMNSPGEGQS